MNKQKLDKKLLRYYLLKYLADIKKIKNILFQVDNIDIQEDELKDFINKHKKYYEKVFIEVEKTKLEDAEKKLFQLVQCGNIRAVELFLKRKDNEKNKEDSKDINIVISLPDDIKDKI